MRRAYWGVLAVTMILPACTSPGDDYRSAAPAPAPASRPTVQQFDSVLSDSAEPVDVLLVGDGTGASLGGWVFLTMQTLSQKYGRPSDIRDWNFDAGSGYVDPATHVSDGVGQPITLWNASISRNIDFLDGALPGMRPPANIDMVLVNNGIDIGTNTLAQESIPLLRRLAGDYPAAAVVAVLQPAPPGDSLNRSNTRALEVSARKNDFQTIDVAAAFDDSTDLYNGSERYANVSGQRVWAEIVTDSLTFDVTVPS